MKCVNGHEIYTVLEGHFEEAGIIYCEKCYAEKRAKELTPKQVEEWFNLTKAIINAEIQISHDAEGIKEKWANRMPDKFNVVG
jgi:hypothetical protein